MKKILVALSLIGYCTLIASPSFAGGDDKDKKGSKKSCCSHKGAKSCGGAEKKAEEKPAKTDKAS